jgi:hypothetical protein
MLLSAISRKQAFLTHLSVSGAVFFVLSYLIVFHWYPDYYFFLDGGNRAIVTIFLVDVVLGPGMTLLVFKPGKKNLKFDVTMILLVQVSALMWGINSVYTGRSATTVFYLGKFTCVSHPDVGAYHMDAIETGPSGKQNLSFLQRPDTVDEYLDFSKKAFANGSSAIYYYSEKIVPLDQQVVKRLDKYRIDLEVLREENSLYADIVHAAVNDQYGENRYQLVPLSCRYGNAVAVYDKEQLKIVDILDVPITLTSTAIDEPLPLSIEPDNTTGTP